MVARPSAVALPARMEAAQLSFVLWLAVVLVMVPTTILTGQVNSFGEFLSLFTGFVTSLALSVLLYLTIKLVEGRPAWLAIALLACGITVTAALQMLGDYGGQYLLHQIFDRHRMPDMSAQSMLVVAAFYWCIDICNVALLWVSSTARRIRRHELELARARAETSEAQLNMLRMQLNPHFMCNALNAISGLVVSGRYGEANAMAEKLADFLRAATEEGVEIALEDELGTVEAYLDVEATRFGERLRVSFDVDPGLEEALVPNFILQPLVENAVKHSVARTTGTVDLSILARQMQGVLILTVENDAGPAAGMHAPARAGGIGLANTRARLAMLYGAAATLETVSTGTGYRAIIRLPYRHAVFAVAAE